MFLIFLSFTIVLFYNIQFLTLISVFSQNDDKKGFGIQERERARIHDGNDSQIVNDDKSGIQERERTRTHAQNESQIFSNDMTRIIIIVTIIVIIGVSSYALYKIYLIRRKSKQSKLK
jgi:Mg2+ and Co2+ transporter CorA